MWIDLTKEEEDEWDEIRYHPMNHMWAQTGSKGLTIAVVNPKYPQLTWGFSRVDHPEIAAHVVKLHNKWLKEEKHGDRME